MILLHPHKVLTKIIMKKMINQMMKAKGRAMMKGGDDDNKDKGETPLYPRVCQNIQRDHPIDNTLGNIEKGVTSRSRVAKKF
jgi:hypothetical protein